MRTHQGRVRAPARTEDGCRPPSRPRTTISLLRHLGSTAGNRAVASALAHVQRVADKDTLTLAHRMLPAGPPRAERQLAMILDLYDRRAGTRYVRWVVQPGLTLSKDVAIEVGLYLSEETARQHRLTWALTTFGEDVSGLRAIFPILATRPPLETVQWAWGLAQGDVARMQSLIDYDATYRSAGDRVHQLSRQVITTANGDAAEATKEMTSLAAYDHDPTLRDWAASQGDVLAAAEVEALKGEAEENYTAKLTAIGDDPVRKRNKKNLTPNQIKDKKAKEKERAEAGLERDAAVGAAIASEPTRSDTARQGMETFLAQARASNLAPDDAKWVLQRAAGRAEVAAILRQLFVKGLNGRSSTDWVLERAPAEPGTSQLVTGLVDAAAAELTEAEAQTVVGLPGWRTLDQSDAKDLATAIKTDRALLSRVVGWLTTAPDLREAAQLLVSWHRKKGPLAEFLAVAEQKPDDLAWLVTNVGAEASLAAVRALQTTLIQGTSKEDLLPLLKVLGPRDAEQVLAKVNPLGQEVDAKFYAVLKKASGPQITSWIVTRQYGLVKLHEWLVERAIPAATLDPLIQWAGEAQLTLLLSERTPPEEVAAVTAHPATTIFDLRVLAWKEKEVGMYRPSLAILAGANTVKGQWDRGTFADPLHSVVYHYCKHVRNENRRATVAQYSAAALNLWTRQGHNAFDWNDGWKIDTGPGRQGGLYNLAGAPYSYWYG